MRGWASAAGFAALLLVGSGLAAPARAACRMLKIGELPVQVDGPHLTVEAQINGRPVRLIVDTGSFATLLFRGSIQQLGLTTKPLDSVRFYGVGGDAGAQMTHVNAFTLSNLVIQNLNLLVAGRSTLGGAQGILGAGFLLQADVEFDLPEGKLRLFRPEGCTGDQVVYWGNAYSATPMIGDNTQQIDVTVLLNGAPLRAEMDTGSDLSVVTTAAAAKAGLTPTSPGVKTVEQAHGLGAQPVQSYVGVFPTFTFGDETIRNAKLRVADLFHADTDVRAGSRIKGQAFEEPQMLLGADFFRSHRVYVSRGQKKVYVSYMGGPVFQARRPPPAVPVTQPPLAGK